MRCQCGSKAFAPLGVQKNFALSSHKKMGKDIYLINCVNCGTTLACSKTFYSVVKYISEHQQVSEKFGKVYEVAK
jgi:hypothetical protein